MASSEVMSVGQFSKQLPSEIIALVISHLDQDGSYIRTLWACCLVSRDWYETAIGPLYTSPRLNNRNFDKFAKTICPPVNSHVRQVGLESLIFDLDMGSLAYESTNSLTARMLRRARVNLRLFVAPAVSFGISCLAPLSKCTKLTTLNLSRDFYDLDLAQLLGAIKGLPIEHLSLPRSAMRRRCGLYPGDPKGAKWPQSLRQLVINDWLPQDLSYWKELFDSWPRSLVSLAFEDCFNWNPFWEVYFGGLAAFNIKDVKISLRRGAELFPVTVLVKIFPDMTTLAMPPPRTLTEHPFSPVNTILSEQSSSLQALTFRPIPGLVRATPWLPTVMLLELVEANPNIYTINIPEAYLQVEDESADSVMERIEELMSSRTSNDDEGGIFLT